MLPVGLAWTAVTGAILESEKSILGSGYSSMHHFASEQQEGLFSSMAIVLRLELGQGLFIFWLRSSNSLLKFGALFGDSGF